MYARWGIGSYSFWIACLCSGYCHVCVVVHGLGGFRCSGDQLRPPFFACLVRFVWRRLLPCSPFGPRDHFATSCQCHCHLEITGRLPDGGLYMVSGTSSLYQYALYPYRKVAEECALLFLFAAGSGSAV